MNVTISAASELDQAAQIFIEARPRLYRVAYRTLRNMSDVEEVVQEAWIKWQGTNRAAVRNPPAFLATTTARLAINAAMSARRRHEAYLDPRTLAWVGPTTDVDDSVDRENVVSQALLALMQTLTPKERAAYLLREAFDYPHQKVAEVLRVSVVYARQLVVRAHRGVHSRPPSQVDPADHGHLLTAFLAAARTGDLRRLEQLLSADPHYASTARQ